MVPFQCNEMWNNNWFIQKKKGLTVRVLPRTNLNVIQMHGAEGIVATLPFLLFYFSVKCIAGMNV